MEESADVSSSKFAAFRGDKKDKCKDLSLFLVAAR